MTPLEQARQIFDRLAEQSKFRRSAIISRRRNADLVDERQRIAMILRNEYGLSFPMIGKVMDRDHSSIVHLCKKRGKNMYSQWRPIAEAPRDGTIFLIPHKVYGAVPVKFWEEGAYLCTMHVVPNMFYHPREWMPLPPFEGTPNSPSGENGQ